jgi:hypothetical protein
MIHLPNLYYVNSSIHSSNTHALHEAGIVKDSLGDFESNTTERLRDGQIKLGAARYEDYFGNERPMVNQMKTGTVSRLTLMNIPERRSEHLWVCPVCKYDKLQTNY